MSHSRSKCMDCSQPPTHECRWAEGRARAWFCDKHWKVWSKEHAGDIDTNREVKGGEVGMKYGEDPKAKKANAKNGLKTGDGTEVGFFIPLSSELAEQFPSLGDNDKSPPHITFLYVGAVPKDKEELFLKTCGKVFEGIREPVRSHLEGLDYFTNPNRERRVAIVRHRFDQDISNVRWALRSALQDAGFTVDDSFPLVYHPHTTLEYLDGFDAKYQGAVPEGDFTFDGIEIWGLPKLHKIPFGNPAQRVARNYMMRLAGLFEEPPAMFNVIWPWFREALAAHVLDYLDKVDKYDTPRSDEELIEWKLLRQECHKYASEAKTYPKQQTKKFKVDLRGWKYTKDPKEDLQKLRMQWHQTPTIDVTLKYGEFSIAGSWSPVLHIMELHIGYSSLTVKSFQNLLQKSEAVLRHELGHAGQTFLNDINEVADYAGLPSKKLRDPDYDESGNLKKGWPGFTTYLEHALIDVEFYTDLKDAVADFMQQLPSIPKDRANDFFRTFVGAAKNRRQIIGTPNQAFGIWKQKAPGKWKKAVVELTKELAKKGVSIMKVGKTFTLNPGDPVLYGKYKNKPGTIKDFKTDEKSGDPVVVVEPYPAGRKQDKEIKLFKIRQDDKPRDDTESSQRVASRYISAVFAAADEYLKAYDAFMEQMSIYKDDYLPGQYSMKLWSAWNNFWHIGRVWGNYIIDNLAIPRNQAKAVEMAVRALQKKTKKSTNGSDAIDWFEKNERYLRVLLEAANWLTRSAETDVFKVGAFTVHNTLGLDAGGLEEARDIIQKATASLPRTGLPGMTQMAYGDVFLVGQLNRPKWAAWYTAQKDSIYLRPNMRGIPQAQVARHLVHELGHRYWKKNSDLARAWVTYDTKMRYSHADVKMPHVGDVLPILVNNKQVRIESEDPKGFILVDTKTGKTVGVADRGKLYDWMRSVAQTDKFPTIYAAKGGAEEHFCEALSLKAFGELKEPNLSGFDHVISGGSPESVRLAARYQEKKTVKTKDGDEATVYVYSERQIANRNKAKADRVEKLRKDLDKLRAQVKKDIKSELGE